MSGIVGLVYFDNRPVTDTDITPMLSAIPHRRTDGSRIVCVDGVGFGHAMLHTTPESVTEFLPLLQKDSDLLLTADARIDNRKELAESFGWSSSRCKTLADSAFILGAYQKWGTQCAAHLLGDFAFALWDGRKQRLYCGRDHMGVKPFYYYSSDNLFIFASEIKSLLATGLIRRTRNRKRIAEFLTVVTMERESTFFEDIVRMPPATWQLITARGSEKTHYWDLDTTAPAFKNRTSADMVEEFREVFLHSLRARIRCTANVGSFLSGGLDSSSIVSMIANQLYNEVPGRLHTFTGIFEQHKSCDEREFTDCVYVRYANELLSHTLNVDTVDMAASFDELASVEDEPFYAPHFFMGRALLSVARRHGVRVAFDGHDGDAAVSYGLGLLNEMASQLRLVSLARECRAICGKNRRKALNLFARSLLAPTVLSRIQNRRMMKMQVRQHLKVLNGSLCNDLAMEACLLDFIPTLPNNSQYERAFHIANITQPIHSMAVEFLERLGHQHGVSFVFPFFAKPLIEFCVSLPGREKLQNGYNRNIVRQAMQGLLPHQLRLRRYKTDFSPSSRAALLDRSQIWLLNNISALPLELFEYVDSSYVNTMIKKVQTNPHLITPHEKAFLLKILSLARWIEQSNC